MTIQEVKEMPVEDYAEWVAFLALENEKQEKQMKAAKQGRGRR